MTGKLQPALKIGLTTRVVEAVGYSESRDALAADWASFLRFAIPEVSWMSLPNIGREVMDYAQAWNLDGFILTGGNDLGEVKTKDETDFALVEYCIEKDLPAVGICRGLQVIHAYLGGELESCSADIHVASNHPVQFTDSIELPDLRGTHHEVNSFHNQGIRPERVSGRLEPTALTDDGWVEAAHVKNTRLTGVMWHPERGRPFRDLDRKLIRHAFAHCDDQAEMN
jgi:putative glutamine amidotransferase